MTDELDSRIGTGIEGLNDILHGGFTADRLYLIEGMPGSGKTTLALSVPARRCAARGKGVVPDAVRDPGRSRRRRRVARLDRSTACPSAS